MTGTMTEATSEHCVSAQPPNGPGHLAFTNAHELPFGGMMGFISEQSCFTVAAGARILPRLLAGFSHLKV
jgi:hypothetical protein